MSGPFISHVIDKFCIQPPYRRWLPLSSSAKTHQPVGSFLSQRRCRTIHQINYGLGAMFIVTFCIIRSLGTFSCFLYFPSSLQSFQICFFRLFERPACSSLIPRCFRIEFRPDPSASRDLACFILFWLLL